jgi:hypothetical protein
VLYTDGLVERRDEPIDEGIARLVAALRVAPAPPQLVCEHLLGVMSAGIEMTDDAAIVVIQLG